MITLRDALPEYVALRRALGTKFLEPAAALNQFVDFLEGHGAEFVTTDLALLWATKPKEAQRATWARRLTQVRGFATWLAATDPRNEVPPRYLLNVRHRRNKPHIYTDREIGGLMNEAAQLPSSSGLRCLTYVTLIGLLAVTGVRPGEALALDEVDVNLANGVLAINEAKGGKFRFIPIDDSTRDALASYAKRRDELCPERRTEAFLVSESGRRIESSTARRTFARISKPIGLRDATPRRRSGRGPRLQDFRHTFATRRLIEWYRAGLDVQRELPKLSTYLGHSDPCATYWYIQAVPELLQLATERLESGDEQ